MFGKAPAGSDGGAAGAGEIVAIGAADAFDDAELAQTGELSREGCGAAWGRRSARRRPAMLKPGRCRAERRVCSTRLKKLRPLTLRPLTGRGWVRQSSARMPAEKSCRLEGIRDSD